MYRLVTRNSYEREMFDRASMKLGLDKAVLQTMGGPSETNKVTIVLTLTTRASTDVDEVIMFLPRGDATVDLNCMHCPTGIDFCRMAASAIYRQQHNVISFFSHARRAT